MHNEDPRKVRRIRKQVISARDNAPTPETKNILRKCSSMLDDFEATLYALAHERDEKERLMRRIMRLEGQLGMNELD